MNRIAIVADADTGHGFGLAGIDVYRTEIPKKAEELLAGFLNSREYVVVAYSEEYISDLPDALRIKMEESVLPVYIAVPSVRSWEKGEAEEEYLANVLKRALGFYVNIKR